MPGLVTAQHAGDGKAEQISLRDFDIDPGTDITLTVDGMPVNMVSHAHGQGMQTSIFSYRKLSTAWISTKDRTTHRSENFVSPMALLLSPLCRRRKLEYF